LGGTIAPVHRTTKLSFPTPAPGAPSDQSKSRLASTRLSAGLPVNALPLKYSPRRPRSADFPALARRHSAGTMRNACIPSCSHPLTCSTFVPGDTFARMPASGVTAWLGMPL